VLRSGSSGPGSVAAPTPGSGPLSRRSALRLAAVAAAGLAAAGCGTHAAATASSSAAAPTQAAANTIHILWRPWYNFNNATSKAGEALLLQGIQPWLAKNPGVDVTITYLGYQGTTVSALLAGNGPDIFADWVLPLYTGANLLLDLSSYAKQDNVDLSIFAPGEMELFQQGGGLWALPSYLHLECPAVNLGALDNLGLSYPESGWTYEQWTQLYQRIAAAKAPNGHRYMAGQFYWSGYDYHGGAPHAYYLKGFSGEYVDPTDDTKCYLTSQGSQQCLSWIYGLLNSNVSGTGASFINDQLIVGSTDTAGGLINAATAGRSMKWQIYDEPVYPAGKIAYAASDFYAISAATKNPSVVWEFMKYLCVETDWQKWMMKLAMNGPNQKTLYPEWVTTLKAIAPPLANIDLDVFNRQMQNNEPYFGLTFRYDDPQAGSAIGTNLTMVQNRQATVPVATAQATQQVDALEAAGATLAGQQQDLAKEFPAVGRSIAPVLTGI
jgi:ABC-type glycerol-3-phosphate transport system substrate-binding protein